MRSSEPIDSARKRLLRRAYAIARSLSLTDDERHQLAMMIPSLHGAQDGVSWASLDPDELYHLCIMLEGAQRVLELYRLRP